MKCLKAIKPTKNVEVGKIVRVDDKEADLKVKDGYWEYTSKSEWRKSKGVEKSTEEVSEPQETKVENKKSKKNAKNN